MSNVISEDEWIKWYPEEIYLKHIKNNTQSLNYLNKLLKEKKFYESSNDNKINKTKKNCSKLEKIDLEQMNCIKKKSYDDGFKKGLLEGKKENILLTNKLNNFFSEFEHNFSIIEKQLYTRLINIILKISSYIVGKKVNFDKSILLDHIKQIINDEAICFNKLTLFLHSNNKAFIEKKFKDFLSIYQWKLIYDDNMDLNDFKIKSEGYNLDSTVDARWQELYRLIDLEEY
ncbi:hypothetical protein ATN01_00370 [Buchnera aphidicola (Diuraphis noxia)]|uniref:Flagellar assembly protein FliH n=1 Tax=Buchnera aphidicola subsp. Diuraphis noxia TaxID=118101 RepID=A0A1B2H7Z7_BUCDN|nr:flagellar assembly protein FliH [Buchnera aphidicola]ANZ22320.1 hypothetical protein ATN01_00370 [Buchnera aphidicola (Diuraphis noxia)]